jgi:diguanylate cyclase (GGDEF)-like protein
MAGKSLKLTSLRGRYALLSALLISAILIAMIVANGYVTHLRNATTGNISDRKELLVHSREIRDSAWQTRQLLSSFLLDPYRGEYRLPIRAEMQRARGQLRELNDAVATALPDYLPVVQQIGLIIDALDRSLETIIDTRLNALTQYPSMALAQETMEPINRDFFTAVTLALDETETHDGAHRKSDVFLTLLRVRHLWTQMISNFRIYLANRMGSFREDTLEIQEHDVSALHEQLDIELARLTQHGGRGKLGLQTEDSLDTMKQASGRWMATFRQVLKLHSTDAWRADARQLKESVEPMYQEIWNALLSIDSAIETGADGDIASLTSATDTQEKIFWSVTTLCILFILGGFVALERVVLAPLARLSRALHAEAKGESLEPLAPSGVTETRDLLLAFDTMRQQVHTRRAELEYQTLHDGLTGLGNRTMLERMLTRAIHHAAPAHKSFALLMIDLDRFKEVNDTLGHELGDLLLKEIARRLLTISREPEGIARFGGDEFCMLIADADETAAREAASLIVQVLDRVIEIGPHQLLVGASVGIAMYPRDGETAQVLLQHADVAMYEAKRNRSGHSVYDPRSDQHSVRRLSLVHELRDAIEHGGLELHYQPKLAVATSEFIGVEALLRWTHPTHGRIAPDQIIAMAEQTGLIRPLTRWVLDAALSQNASWREAGLDISVAVNLSANSILDQPLIDWIHNWFAQRSAPPARLVLEVTESAMMADPGKSVEVLTKFAEMGIGISVDDYGTGFSSLAYLKRLPIDELKIDRSFVMEMLSSANDALIVRSTVELAHSLGLRVVAEGVEEAQALDLLATLGCDYAQGYHICRPVPAAELLAWWKSTYPLFVASRIPPAPPAPSAPTPLRIIQR